MIRDRVILLGVAGLTAVATAGWMRQPAASTTAPLVNSFQPLSGEMPALATAAAYTPAAQPGYSRTNSSVRRARPDYDDTRLPRARKAVYEEDRQPATTRERSKKASAAIIGGGAAAGAAIGGLAGGGKGAIIGAVSGGAAGLVYDRMTHKKTEPTNDDYKYRSSSSDEPLRQERSPLKRAAIIGGGAAAGAAIGGAAGGGKGAAIGAIAGGAGGYIYDRVTKDR